MKKILTLCVLSLGVLFLVGCGQQQTTQKQQSASTPEENLKTQISEQPENMPEPAQAADNSKSNNNPMELKIETTKQGTGDRVVKAGDTISVLYTGKLTDGTKFDSSFDHGGQPFSFQVGAGQVIKGWDQGLLGAKIGEKRTLTIPSILGYGAAGISGVIPPNATLIFDIELVSIQ